MADNYEYSEESLNKFSYRFLQQLAKSLGLPSNVKKMYLVQMIFAKKNCCEADVQDIVQRVKLERQQLSQSKKKRNQKKVKLQATEISSTNTSQSPPISNTPKRQSFSESNPQLCQTLVRCQANQPLLSSQNCSDRVLRSFNLKSYKKPNYSVMNNSIIGVIKTQSPKAHISIIRCENGFPKLNVTTSCIVKKCRPSILNSVSCLRNDGQFLSSSNTIPQTKKRHRRITSLLPIEAPETNTMNYPSLQRIGFRHTDGKISKINAIVHKPPKTYERLNSSSTISQNSYRNVEVTIQDIINSNIDAQTFTNPNVSEYIMSGTNIANMSYATQNDALNTVEFGQNNEVREDGDFSVYYHKKIRAEQVRTQRLSIARDVPRNQANEQRLPKINDVFSNFNDVSRDVTRPLYVQVSDADRVSIPLQSQNPPALERLYNIRTLPHQEKPLLQVATSDNTTCVFSTMLISSVMAPSTSSPPAEFQPASHEPEQYEYLNTTDDVSRMSDFFNLAEQDITLRKYHKAFSTSLSSEETQSHVMDTTASIPEMVEDALEIISQDGDYMERIGMDIRMQCILCDWAGPKIILEYHIRKEHAEKLVHQDKNEWNITYKLGSVVNQQLWLSHVSEFETYLYTVSVKFEDPDCFMASLSVLSSQPELIRNGSITIYNKITGEPYTWSGEIQEIPTNMPYENTPQLKLELSKLELVPNSARLKLVGRTLVPVSPGKAVVGQPQLDDIHIIIFVHIF
ncbi:uncharacterized protein LOC113227425 [Hyposmocoma kahamanoa]|uniref:uncharacterized protein LOC113227425 n=1 Tax=Hyposmocoma kahamanoa TaxID=1477025 RepID=UPI000E6D86CC|nr:uncharacterized protein LOC113227425 [Hyposmocoma kahamanoa]